MLVNEESLNGAILGKLQDVGVFKIQLQKLYSPLSSNGLEHSYAFGFDFFKTK